MRRFTALFLLLALSGTIAPAGEAGSDATDQAAKPELRLRVSTHSGVIPLELELKGRLIGVDLETIKACYLRSEWTYDSPGGFKFYSGIEEVPCAGEGKEAVIPEAFEKSLLIDQPGTYSYRIILEPIDGRRRAGTSQEVRVFRSRFELGVTLHEE